ncbi:MAG: type VI secretion system-associated FHA domain protein TagH [Roseiarcus sp.]
MQLRLTIENMDRLPDGGPVRVQVEGRGLDIGRDQHLDWTLPDPTRHVSSKHCEIRFRDGGYWLHDVSTNGTFVNGAQFRLDAPYLLKNGDRLSIGQYIVAVEVEGQQAPASPFSQAPGGQSAGDLWGSAGEAAAPEDRRDYLPERPRQATPDFLDFASGLAPAELFPPPPAPAAELRSPALGAPDDWLRGKAPPPIAEPIEPIAPTPRRPAPPRPAPGFATTRPPQAPVAASAVETWPSGAAAREDSPAPASVADALVAQPDALTRIARAAGIPERAIAGRDPGAVADDIGAVLRLMALNLAQMLSSRSETKSLMRSSSRTMIRALENNPLKFTAGPEEALAIMLGPPTRNYLDAKTTVERSFADLKAHQMQTYGAMQGALEALFEDLAPDKIDASVEADRGLGALVGSRKAKLWDTYVERWRAKTKRSDGRLSEAFMLLFAESYDRLQRKEP